MQIERPPETLLPASAERCEPCVADIGARSVSGRTPIRAARCRRSASPGLPARRFLVSCIAALGVAALGHDIVLAADDVASDLPSAMTTAPASAEPTSDDAALETQLAEARARFVAAREALADGDGQRFAELEATLLDYPLHGWLVHERLQQRFRRETPTAADVGVVETFEDATGDIVLSTRLVRTLQTRFAERKDWQAFLDLADHPRARTMTCETLQAREATAPMTAFDEATLALWIEPGNRSDACAAALDSAVERLGLPTSAVWARVYAAMDANRPRHADAALERLSTRHRRPVEAWIAARDEPGDYLESGALAADSVLNRRMLADLVLHWSKEDTPAAIAFWLAAHPDYAFYEDRRHDTHRALVMRAAYRRMPEAPDWLETFEPREDDLEFAEWRVRVALLAGDWARVDTALGRLPREERAEDHWAYWDARSLEERGEAEAARRIYTRLAELQSWHGFLSAERLGVEPLIEDVPIDPSTAMLSRLAVDPALVRSREYHRVGLEGESRREWNAWLSDREEEEIAAAAVLAARWRLDDRAIFSAGRAERRQALSLRFPVLYAGRINAAAAEQEIEASWIYGVARRESAFIADIRSPAGARGLMQLMPATAKQVAGWRGQKDWDGDLNDPATNIAFGAHYLRYVLDRFDGHQALATASYNAGPHRVAGWLPDGEAMEADRWIDTIPFTETRRYVRAVLAYAAIYEKRLTGEDYRLLERLPEVPAAPGDEASRSSDIRASRDG